jgi:hypothetical protein
VTAAVRVFFAEFEVSKADYRELVEAMPGSDPDDPTHMAAAIAGRADTIVTWNRRDFPAELLAAYGIAVMDPDRYLCGLMDDWPDEVVATVERLAGEKRRPPLSSLDLVATLTKAGVPAFGDRLRAALGRPASAPA